MERVTDADGIREMQKNVSEVGADRAIVEYISHLSEATHEHAAVLLGVSPRGSLAVLKMAQARAYVQGRDFVIPEDVMDVFGDVCGHRLVLQAKSRMEQITPETVVRDVLDRVPTPMAGE